MFHCRYSVIGLPNALPDPTLLYSMWHICALLSFKIQTILNSGAHMAIGILNEGLPICNTFLLGLWGLEINSISLFNTSADSRHLMPKTLFKFRFLGFSSYVEHKKYYACTIKQSKIKKKKKTLNCSFKKILLQIICVHSWPLLCCL